MVPWLRPLIRPAPVTSSCHGSHAAADSLRGPSRFTRPNRLAFDLDPGRRAQRGAGIIVLQHCPPALGPIDAMRRPEGAAFAPARSWRLIFPFVRMRPRCEGRRTLWERRLRGEEAYVHDSK